MRYNDKAMLVSAYTETHGTICFISRGRKLNLLRSPLGIVELVYDYRERKNLQSIKEARLAEPYSSLPFHPVKSAIALFLGEFLTAALRGEQHPTPGLYAYFETSLLWLDSRPSGFANFPIAFLLHMARPLGIFPTRAEAEALCLPAERPFVAKVMRMNFATMHLFRFGTQQRQRLLSLVTEFYRTHVPGFPALRSLSILREVLA